MRKYAVLGAGLMGKVVAKNLLDEDKNSRVTLLDNSKKNLKNSQVFIDDDRLDIRNIDIYDHAKTVDLLKGHDAAVAALPHGFSLKSIEAAIEAGVDIVDLVGSYPEKRVDLHQKALDKEVIVIPGLGVAPGLSNVCVGHAVNLLDETQDAVIYVGGIPKVKTPPLDYQTVYTLESVFKVYNRLAKIYTNGKLTEVEPLTGYEMIDFPDPIGQLEAYFTDGLASLTITMENRVKNSLEEKTLRYPGFVEKVKFLKDCGFLEDNDVEINKTRIKPIDALVTILGSKLELGPEGDILAMRVIVSGIKDGSPKEYIFELIDHFDPGTGYTAMARTTGLPAAVAARMIARDQIYERGVIFPEDLFKGALYDTLMYELEKFNINLTMEER
ncbi:MAG: hypothetical protein GY863_01145 [bacterium]|nr:hypothetical protein [bacterium]